MSPNKSDQYDNKQIFTCYTTFSDAYLSSKF